MAAENSNKLKLKTDTRNRKSAFTLVTPNHISVFYFLSWYYTYHLRKYKTFVWLGVTKVKVLFLFLVSVFHSVQF